MAVSYRKGSVIKYSVAGHAVSIKEEKQGFVKRSKADGQVKKVASARKTQAK
ncbi:MAG: hypothetical protein ACM3UW_05435 [Bacillota bacterium]